MFAISANVYRLRKRVVMFVLTRLSETSKVSESTSVMLKSSMTAVSSLMVSVKREWIESYRSSIEQEELGLNTEGTDAGRQ